jgi:ABC-type phosphate transport system substrate-binding protein
LARWHSIAGLGTALLAFVLIFGGSIPARAQSGKVSGIAIVAHPGIPVDNLSLTDLRKIFLGQRQYWDAGHPVVLLVRAPVAREREIVLHVIYDMSETQFKQYWIAKIFRSEMASPPKVVTSQEMTNQLIQLIPGSIGFVPAGQATQAVKVIKIDGKLPGDTGYALH